MSLALHHVVRQPKKESNNPPLLIMLHGYGSNELDLFSFAEELQDDFLIVSARAPLTMMMGGYAWYTIHWDASDGKFSDIPEAKASLEKIDTFIEELKNEYNPSKIFLLGFSQGAILSYAYTLNFPNKVDHVIALSGYVNSELLPTEVDKTIQTDYYASHGSVDQVLPVDLARKSIPFIKDLGLDIEYSEYPVGHGVAPQNFYSFKDWIDKRL